MMQVCHRLQGSPGPVLLLRAAAQHAQQPDAGLPSLIGRPKMIFIHRQERIEEDSALYRPNTSWSASLGCQSHAQTAVHCAG